MSLTSAENSGGKPAGLNRTSSSADAPPAAMKSWWVHLWDGLVRDPAAKHYKAIRGALWLYLYLLVAANWRDGTLFRRIDTIVAETGYSRRTVHRWLRTLRKKGYITTASTGRALHIAIKRWRPIYKRRPP